MADEKPTTPPVPTINSATGTDGVTRASVDTSVPATPPATKPADRPAWLPEGIDTPEALAKAYADLKAGTPAPKSTETQPDPTKVVADAGLDMNALAAEYAKEGKLSDASMKALTDKGITKAQIDSYIEGQSAIAQNVTRELNDAVGGEETMKSMLQWAPANLSKDEIAAYNKAVTSGDLATAKLLVAGIASKFLAAVGTEPSLLNSEGRPTNTGAQPFNSNSEVVTAMRDKRYKTDPAYRASVERRLAVTNTQNVRSY